MSSVTLWIESAFTLDPFALQLHCGRQLQDFSHGLTGRLDPPGHHGHHAVEIPFYFPWGWRNSCGSTQGKDYPDFIGEPLTTGIVVHFLLRNSITEVDQYLANVKFCLALFCLHLSRADDSVLFSAWVGLSTFSPSKSIPETVLSGSRTCCSRWLHVA